MTGYPTDRGRIQVTDEDVIDDVNQRLVTYRNDTSVGQSGGPVWVVDGTDRIAVAIHTGPLGALNRGTRINQEVLSLLAQWKDESEA